MDETIAKTLENENFAIPVACFSICFVTLLSANGSAKAISAASTSSIMHSQKKSILVKAYVAVLLASTIFMYAFIVALSVAFKINKGYEMEKAYRHLIACFIYGLTAYFGGNAMTEICKQSFCKISEVPGFFISFMILMTSIEVMLIFAMIFSLILI
ncbi:hypothetical protein GVAV_002946 [Gurleya vavrai]